VPNPKRARQQTFGDNPATSPGRSSPGAARTPVRKGPPGLATRQAAVRVIAAVLGQHRSLDDALTATEGLEPRDRAFARLIAATVIRRMGELEAVLRTYLTKPLPRKTGALWPILLSASAQLLMASTPAHAAISLAVDQCRADRDARHFDKLANAVLRRVAADGPARLTELDGVALNIPSWLLDRWTATYGADLARAIATAQLQEAPLDISVKQDASTWAERLGGLLLPTGSIRLEAPGRIEDLPGFADGAWWVQDVAATLPVRLLGPLAGREIADLCAAPGGKTAQLAASGARVTAVDLSERRLERVRENLARLALSAETIAADVGDWQPGRTFDAVLLDLPCTATGTIRRNPDILRLKRESDIAALAAIQAKLLDATAALVRPGGTMIACVCSLEPEESEILIDAFLTRRPDFVRAPIAAEELAGRSDWITSAGDLRTLPCHAPLPPPAPAGMDGFFAARLRLR
jgi:16S rRNA (cytosine967-C5)-methyltransferase